MLVTGGAYDGARGPLTALLRRIQECVLESRCWMNRGWIRPPFFLSFFPSCISYRMFVYTCGYSKKKKSLQSTRTNSGQSGTTNHRSGGKSVGVEAGCVLFFFFFSYIYRNTHKCNAMPYHTIPYLVGNYLSSFDCPPRRLPYSLECLLGICS